jgi:hypothetical protein
VFDKLLHCLYPEPPELVLSSKPRNKNWCKKHGTVPVQKYRIMNSDTAAGDIVEISLPPIGPYGANLISDNDG